MNHIDMDQLKKHIDLLSAMNDLNAPAGHKEAWDKIWLFVWDDAMKCVNGILERNAKP
jgi:hypothetical protein